MSLDSSGSCSAATRAERTLGDTLLSPKDCHASVSSDSATPWVFLFAHKMKLARVEEILKERFETYVHSTVTYVRNEAGVSKSVRPTISGLIFVHGNPAEVKRFLAERLPWLHLAVDYTSGRAAKIANREMQAFMRLSSLDERKVRFLVKPIEYYADGKPYIRILSGALEGLEGYVVRLHRDRCLVTSMGNISVAISGIHKDNFVNASEYVAEKKATEDSDVEDDELLTPIDKEVGKVFFHADCEIDAMAIANSLDSWLGRASTLRFRHDYEQAAAVCLSVLRHIGAFVPAKFYTYHSVGFKELIADFEEVIVGIAEIRPDLDIEVELEGVRLSYPELPLKSFE